MKHKKHWRINMSDFDCIKCNKFAKEMPIICDKCYKQLQAENERLENKIEELEKFLGAFKDSESGNYTLEDKT